MEIVIFVLNKEKPFEMENKMKFTQFSENIANPKRKAIYAKLSRF